MCPHPYTGFLTSWASVLVEIRGGAVNDLIVTEMFSIYIPLAFRICFNVGSVQSLRKNRGS